MTEDPERYNAMAFLLRKPGNQILAWIQSQPKSVREPMWMLADFLEKSLELLDAGRLIQLISLIAADEDPPTAGASWRRATEEE